MPEPSWEEAKSAAKQVEPEQEPAKEPEKEPAQETAQEPEPAPKPEETKTKETQDTDYEAELERYKKKLAQQIRANKRLQESKYPEKEEQETPDYEAIIERKAQEKIEGLRRELAEDNISQILDSLTSNPHERELIRAVYENEVTPSGFAKAELERDLKKAYLLANADRFEAEAIKKATQEVRQELAGKKAALDASKGSTAGGDVGREPPQTDPTENLNEREKMWLEKLGEYQKTYGLKK